MDQPDVTKRSVVVSLLADMASKGKYDNVTAQSAANMNTIFKLVANLINELEAEEAAVEADEEESVDGES